MATSSKLPKSESHPPDDQRNSTLNNALNSAIDGALNIALIGGDVCREPERKELSDGSIRLAFDIRGPEGEVAITWFGAPNQVPSVRNGRVVTVVGHVRRHFYRNGSGAVVSRTDVVARRVVSGMGKRRADLIADAGHEIVAAVEG